MPDLYKPDFAGECSICNACPTVIVIDHSQPDTDLCGACFFADRAMIDWTLWNEQMEESE